uniref:Uncharacterized protein n=1 Tax=Triticum urartu TaxID=4572 RepID=A0A8R7UVS5_TRIUA
MITAEAWYCPKLVKCLTCGVPYGRNGTLTLFRNMNRVLQLMPGFFIFFEWKCCDKNPCAGLYGFLKCIYIYLLCLFLLLFVFISTLLPLPFCIT